VTGGIPTGSDPAYLTPHPFSIMGGVFSQLGTWDEPTVREIIENRERNNPSMTQVSDEVFRGLDPSLGMVAGTIEAIFRRMLGAIPLIDMEDPDGPAVQLLDQMETFFTNWRAFLDDINFLDPDFDLAQAQQSFAQNVIQPFITAVGNVLNSIIPAGLIPLFGVGQVGDYSPNLFLNGDFADPEALNSSTIYTHDAAVGNFGAGSAKTIANGTTRPLFSNHILVAPGQKVDIAAYVLYSGVTSGANGIKVRATPFNNQTAGSPVIIDQITPSGTLGAWHKMSGQYVTPGTGVTSIVVELLVDTPVTAGTVWWDDALAQKLTANNLIPRGFISGLQDALDALTSLVDFNALKNTLGAGVSTLTAIGNRLNFLNPTGMFDASQLTNLPNLPTIPNLLTKAPDMQTHMDDLSNALSGALTGGGTPLVNTALTQAKNVMANLFDQMSNNTRKLQDLESQMTTGGASTPSAKMYTVNFANYPDGAFPSGIFNITMSGPGTSSLGISGGKAVWNLVNNGNRTAFLQYAPGGTPAATGTDYQVIRGTMSGPPGNGSNTRIWAIGRMNASGTDYVWARGYCTGFLSYKGDIGCTVGGVETVWRSNVSLTWSLDMRLICGVGNNPRRYQVISGETIVVDLVHGSGGFTDNSVMAADHRYWGSRSDTNGSTNPGSIAGASVYDKAPPANIQGTAFRASRRVTTDTTVPSSSNGAMFPNNFFETVDYISDDLTYTPNSNCRVTVQTPGTYLCTWRVRHGLYASGSMGEGVLYKNGVRECLGGIADTQFSAGFAVIVSKQDATAFVGQVYCNAGDYINPGMHFSSSMSDTGDTSMSDGAETYFCVTRVGAT
jgi:hypothetical protein